MAFIYTVPKLILAGLFFFVGGFMFLRIFYEDFKKTNKLELVILSIALGVLINVFLGFFLGVFEKFNEMYLWTINLFWVFLMELFFFVKHKRI